SDTNSLALTTATSQAVAGSHSITVTKLAQNATSYSAAIPAADTLAGSITLQVGSQPATTIAVNSQNPTLSGLAAAINQAGVGINASVISDSSGARLSLVSTTSGAAGAITVGSTQLQDASSGSPISFTPGQQGQDAQLVVDGIPLSSSGNTVSNVIPGVTFQLLNITSSPVQVQIANDTGSATTAISTFVKDYNAVVSALNAQEGKDSSGNAEPLFGNPLIASIQQQLSSALTKQQAAGIRSIGDLGLQMNGDGTLTINNDSLTQALTSQFTDVQSFFQGAGSFGVNMMTAVNNSGSSNPLGTLNQATQSNARIESSLNDSVATMDASIATQKTLLTAQLNAANQTLQLIPLQVNEINQLYSAITGYNTKA
ncbi:MAG: flagellar hook-associated protein 2, partial [Acidobacteriaceae bacterium]|nr:flagellar hook-associated protein 2 [Acidobacteriaceae bacterium]